MRIGELIDLLSKCPKNDIVCVEMDESEEAIDADISDVLVGNGTLKGFSYIRLKNGD